MSEGFFNIGVVTMYVENFYFGSLLKGILSNVKKENGRLYIFNTYMMDKFRTNVKGDEEYYSFSFNHIDGWIVFCVGVKEEYLNMVVNTGKPVVQIGSRKNYYNSAIVIDDSYNGAKQVVEHLLYHGHKRIAYVGDNNVDDMVERCLGYKEVLDAHGFFDKSIVYNVQSPMPEYGKLFPYMVDNYSWECIGFWENEKSGHETFKVKDLYDICSKEKSIDLDCSIKNFPPLELIPKTIYKSNDDIIWIMPISSTTKNWGVIAYSSPFNEATAMIKYNIFVLITALLAIAMDREVAKTDLLEALETLKQTQNQLIQSEKMAALGGLVAGVAHEVNTPIGVSVTAASYLDEKNKEILKLLEAGKLKRVDLEKHIDTTIETVKILSVNLERALNLITGFKQITAHESMETKKKFFIKDCIEEVFLGLNSKIKEKKHTIYVNCEDDMEIYACQEGVAQIITNLVLNSFVHGFEDIKEGIISINVFKQFEETIIEYNDNGKGISENDIKKIFEPFFTTRRGRGGTGLGLNIVYNIVNNELKGNIKCKSAFGNGTTFIITIPTE
ncbi:UNVERIFIED_CONTAM: signal transduction histidine kinase [Acetivibrio alkalicellulosi]